MEMLWFADLLHVTFCVPQGKLLEILEVLEFWSETERLHLPVICAD